MSRINSTIFVKKSHNFFFFFLFSGQSMQKIYIYIKSNNCIVRIEVYGCVFVVNISGKKWEISARK